MKIYCIVDNPDTLIGLKLAGCDGIALEDDGEIEKNINNILENREYGILVLTKKIYNMKKEKIDDIRLNKKLPLISII